MAVWIGDDGAVFEVPYDGIRKLASSLKEKPLSEDISSIPVEEGKLLVQNRLANLVGSDNQARALAGW